MNSRFKKFATGFTVYTLIIVLISVAVYLWIPAIPVNPGFPYIILLMYSVTLLILVVLMKNMENRLSLFANAFMLVNFSKMILYSAIILVYAWLNREDAVGFILLFFIYYLLFTAYEVVALLRQKG